MRKCRERARACEVGFPATPARHSLAHQQLQHTNRDVETVASHLAPAQPAATRWVRRPHTHGRTPKKRTSHHKVQVAITAMRVVPTALLILAACSLRAWGSVPGSRRNSDTLISDAAQMPRPLNPRPLPVLSPRALRPSTQASRPRTGMHERHPGQAACKEMWFTQQLDHFAWNNDATWQQRYFVCDAEWRQPTPASPAGKR